MLNKSWLIAAGTGAAAVAITTCSLAKYAANVIQRMGDKGIQNKIDNILLSRLRLRGARPYSWGTP